MEMVDKLMELLKEKHGNDLDIKNDVYYLFLKGGLFSIWYDEDERQIKVNVEFLPEDNTFVYFTDEDIEELI
jgi:hypothetical protein